VTRVSETPPPRARSRARRISLRLLTLAFATLALAACHGPLAVGRAVHAAPGSAPGWLEDPHLATRTAAAAAAMARVWGGNSGDLDGWTIRYSDRFIETHGRSRVVGKSTRTPLLGGGTIEIWAGTSYVCLEATDLAHEVGHVVIRDHHHRDSRWLDRTFWDRMAAVLRSIIPRNDVSCRERLASGSGIWH